MLSTGSSKNQQFPCRGPRRHLCTLGGYLDFSHLTESNNIYITEIYMKKKKKKNKSSIIKNHKITLFMVFP